MVTKVSVAAADRAGGDPSERLRGLRRLPDRPIPAATVGFGGACQRRCGIKAHDQPEMAPDLCASRLCRASRTALCRAARDAVFSGELSYRSCRRGPAGGGRGRARHRRRRAADRMASAAARRKASRALFPRQRRLAALAGRSLPRADRRRHRAGGAQLPRLRRLDRPADRGGPGQRCGGGLCIRRRALPGAAYRALGRVARLGRRGRARGSEAGRTHRARSPRSPRPPTSERKDIGSCRCGC